MGTFSKEQGGPAILADLRTRLSTLGMEMRGMAAQKELPKDYRAEQLIKKTEQARLLVFEAERAFQAWAEETTNDAREAYRRDPVGNAADEIRRNTNELRLGRIVEAAKAEDARLGARIPVGSARPVTNASAWGLADRAEDAYFNGDYEAAQLYARASQEMGGPDKAARIFSFAQDQLDQQNPTRAAALKELAEVQRGTTLFVRDANGSMSSLYQDAAVLAEAVGDQQLRARLTGEATRSSLRAKASELTRAAVPGNAPYTQPEGALPDAPARGHIMTESEISRLTQTATGTVEPR